MTTIKNANTTETSSVSQVGREWAAAGVVADQVPQISVMHASPLQYLAGMFGPLWLTITAVVLLRQKGSAS